MLKKILNNIESLLMILVSIVFFLLNSFGLESILGIPINEITLLTLILAMLAMILYKLMEVKTSEINDTLKVTNTKFDDLLLLSKGNISAIDPKKEPQIWSNFHGTFYAVNAPWKLEENAEIGYDAIVDEYIKDYEKENLTKLIYVFYEKSNYPNAINKFANFIKIVSKESTMVKNKLNILFIKEEAPRFSLFFGYKSKFSHSKQNNKFKDDKDSNLHSYSVIYMNDKPFVNKNGSPNWVFISADKSLNNVIENHIHQVANDNEELMTVDQFLKWHASYFK